MTQQNEKQTRGYKAAIKEGARNGAVRAGAVLAASAVISGSVALGRAIARR